MAGLPVSYRRLRGRTGRASLPRAIAGDLRSAAGADARCHIADELYAAGRARVGRSTLSEFPALPPSAHAGAFLFDPAVSGPAWSGSGRSPVRSRAGGLSRPPRRYVLSVPKQRNEEIR